MALTIFISFVLFLVSLLFSYICNVFFINPYVLFVLPIIFILIIIFSLETLLSNKNKINRPFYNVIMLQIPAIFGVLIALILWFSIDNEIMIRTFYYSSKYLYIPVLLIRFIFEIFKNRDKNILISSGFILGILIGFSFIM